MRRRIRWAIFVLVLLAAYAAGLLGTIATGRSMSAPWGTGSGVLEEPVGIPHAVPDTRATVVVEC